MPMPSSQPRMRFWRKCTRRQGFGFPPKKPLSSTALLKPVSEQFCTTTGRSAVVRPLFSMLRPTPAGVGLSIENNGLTTADLPVVVQNCSLTGFNNAVLLSGFLGGKPNPCRRVHFRQNRIRGCELGIGMTGLLQDIHIVGNTIWNCAVDGDIVLAGVAKDSKGLVIANNSLQDPRYAIHLEQPIDEDIGLVIRNNVVLAEAGPDLAFTGKRPLKLSNIQIDHNFREFQWTLAGEG